MKGDWKYVSIGGGVLSVVMDGHNSTHKYFVIVLDMISLVSMFMSVYTGYMYIKACNNNNMS